MGRSSVLKNPKNRASGNRNIRKLKHGEGGSVLEVDYLKAKQWLRDDAGMPFQPLIILFVHKESYFLLDAYMVMPHERFLTVCSDRLLKILKTGPIAIGKIMLKKRDLFDAFGKTASDLGIGIELVKRLPAAESVKRDMAKFLNTMTASEDTDPGKERKKVGFKNVYQFKILLSGSKPPIWRRIQVPETYSFWDLHVAIQDAMGWADCHLHEFQTIRKSHGTERSIGIPDPEIDDSDVEPGWKEMISDVFPEEKKMRYVYDFGDYWVHTVTLEKILPREAGSEYPTCIAGRMACPPEDSGALWGYYDMLEILKHPKHPEYKDTVEWIGDERFDPEEFDPEEVSFGDPERQLRERGIEC